MNPFSDRLTEFRSFYFFKHLSPDSRKALGDADEFEQRVFPRSKIEADHLAGNGYLASRTSSLFSVTLYIYFSKVIIFFFSFRVYSKKSLVFF